MDEWSQNILKESWFSMNIAHAIMYRYPNADPTNDFSVQDDGTGSKLAIWNLSEPQPTDEQINSWWLEFVRSEKIKEMNSKCEESILYGFDSASTGYTFDFTDYDQMNMTQQLILFIADPTMTTVQWKTKNSGIVELTKEQFMTMVGEANTHKRNNIGKYWTLKSQVQSATMEEEINAIVW